MAALRDNAGAAVASCDFSWLALPHFFGEQSPNQ
jgi:hypothetical protein